MKRVLLFIALCSLFAIKAHAFPGAIQAVVGMGANQVTGNVSCSNLTSGGNNTFGHQSSTTASITPSANALILATVVNFPGSGSAGPTDLSGNSLTWVQVATVAFNASGRALTVFRAMGASPSSGTLTINFTGTNQFASTWSVDECANTDTTGTNGSGAIVQSGSATGSSTAPSVTLAAFGSAANATFGAVGNASGSTVTHTAGTGFTELADTNAGTDNTGIETEWRQTNDTTVDATISGSTAWGIIGIEIKD